MEIMSGQCVNPKNSTKMSWIHRYGSNLTWCLVTAITCRLSSVAFAYNPAFINGLKNIRTLAFKEHADKKMYKCAMMLYTRQW